ncbi:MAG: hypothetical protein MPW16_15555 [Candidatus Manganitrophus sp.]|nr:MAG: hypothetical protein MPW16_15555 [Candidatus Manganitrophus sp.]
MMKKATLLFRLAGGILLLSLFAAPAPAEPGRSSESPAAPAAKEAAGRRDILVEIFLAPERKNEADAVKKEFEALSITKVRPQVFRKGHPPQNIGFGKEIPADVARQAIQLALKYNDGIQFLLPEKRLAAHYIGIGVSIFDEAFQIPVSPEELKRISDPSLTDDQFHQLYREMTDKPPRINR